MPIDYRGAYPFWYYGKIELADIGASLGSQYFIRKIKSGFNYWIRGLLISYPHDTNVGHPDDVSPPLYISLVQTERNRNITEIPIPAELLSNPGGNEPPPPGHSQHSRPLYNGFIRWDYLLSNADVIKIKIEGHTLGAPEYIRLAVVGHNIKAGNHV